jgi:hypothetical protein
MSPLGEKSERIFILGSFAICGGWTTVMLNLDGAVIRALP